MGSWRTAGLEISAVCEVGWWALVARFASSHLDAIRGAPSVPDPGQPSSWSACYVPSRLILAFEAFTVWPQPPFTATSHTGVCQYPGLQLHCAPTPPPVSHNPTAACSGTSSCLESPPPLLAYGLDLWESSSFHLMLSPQGQIGPPSSMGPVSLHLSEALVVSSLNSPKLETLPFMLLYPSKYSSDCLPHHLLFCIMYWNNILALLHSILLLSL